MAPQVRRKAAERLALLVAPHLEKVAQRIVEGLDAQETKFFQKDGIITDTRDVIAWDERRNYAELAMTALQIAPPKSSDSGDSGSGIQIQILYAGAQKPQDVVSDCTIIEHQPVSDSK